MESDVSRRSYAELGRCGAWANVFCLTYLAWHPDLWVMGSPAAMLPAFFLVGLAVAAAGHLLAAFGITRIAMAESAMIKAAAHHRLRQNTDPAKSPRIVTIVRGKEHSMEAMLAMGRSDARTGRQLLCARNLAFETSAIVAIGGLIQLIIGVMW